MRYIQGKNSELLICPHSPENIVEVKTTYITYDGLEERVVKACAECGLVLEAEEDSTEIVMEDKLIDLLDE